MPLTVDTFINNKSLGWLKISRLEDLTGSDDEHTYQAQSISFPQGLTQYAPETITTTFTHKYSDGYQVCVAKAMLAIAYKEKNNG